MINDYSVLIKYKNRRNEYVGESVYPFVAYVNMISNELKKCLNDIEKSFIAHSAPDDITYEAKDDAEFLSIRKQILDAANAIQRMPETVCYRGLPISSCKASDYISNIIDNV